ncbi:MAG: nitroreductase family deazaflavin-dependent oxidoreductase [Actinomycetota bacterium]
MAKTFKVGLVTRLANLPFKIMTRLGLGLDDRHLLSVRESGKVHSVPVDVMRTGDRRWLVAPYGVVGWVRNARAAGEVSLARGGRRETVRIEELGPEESVAVLRKYLEEVPVTRPYFDVTPDSSNEAFAVEARKHPVFRIIAQDQAQRTA